MNLQILTKAIHPVKITGSLDRDNTAICYDSRRVIEGALFVALPGEKTDGTQFIDAAIDRGAAAIVSEKPAFCLLVIFDEAKVPDHEDVGGLVAAPVFRAIAERSLTYLGVAPDPALLRQDKEATLTLAKAGRN